MAATQKTAIVTGGSQLGAGLVKAFLGRGYNVVANSRNITKLGAFEASDKLALARIVRLGVSVATSGDVRDQPKVADAASELLQNVFGKDKPLPLSVWRCKPSARHPGRAGNHFRGSGVREQCAY